MKFTTLLGTAALVCATGTALGQITNSPHDFSSYAWSGGEICKPCHTTHFANTTAGRLWNHELSTATYTLFEGETGTSADLDRESRLCMSCHDGTVALDSFGGQTGTSFIPGRANVGTDLRDDHPIGKDAVYPTTTSTRFNPQNTSHQIPVPGTTTSLRLKSWTNTAGVEQYVVGCRTCHNVHNAGNFDHMLYVSNSASKLCLACHIK